VAFATVVRRKAEKKSKMSAPNDSPPFNEIRKDSLRRGVPRILRNRSTMVAYIHIRQKTTAKGPSSLMPFAITPEAAQPTIAIAAAGIPLFWEEAKSGMK